MAIQHFRGEPDTAAQPTHRSLVGTCSSDLPTHRLLVGTCSVDQPTNRPLDGTCSVNRPTHHPLDGTCSVDLPTQHSLGGTCSVDRPTHCPLVETGSTDRSSHHPLVGTCFVGQQPRPLLSDFTNTLLPSINEEELDTNVRKLFALSDVNGDGFINLREFERHLAVSGIRPGREVVEQIYSLILCPHPAPGIGSQPPARDELEEQF